MHSTRQDKGLPNFLLNNWVVQQTKKEGSLDETALVFAGGLLTVDLHHG